MSKVRIFISYSHADSDAIAQDVETLLSSSYEVSYDRGITPGTDWRSHIANDLIDSAVVLYYSSEAANRSKHCLAEVGFALDLDKKVLVVQLDESDLTAGLRMYLGGSQALRRYELEYSEYAGDLSNAISRLVVGNQVELNNEKPKLRISASPVRSVFVLLVEAFIRQISTTSDRNIELVDAEPDISISEDGNQLKLSDTRTDEEVLVELDADEPVDFLNRFWRALCAMVSARSGVDLYDDDASAALRASTRNVEALVVFLEGLFLDKTVDLHGARAKLEEALRLDPDFTLCSAHAAVVSLNLGDSRASKSHFSRAFAGLTNLSDKDQYSLRSTFLIANGDFERAAEELERFLKAYPNRTAPLQNLALSYLYSRNPKAAVETARKSLSLAANYFDQANFAMYLMYAGEFEKCEEKLLDIGTHGSVYDLATTMAICQAMTGNVEEAERIYESLRIGSHSQRLAGYLGLADLYAYTGDYERALVVCREAPESNDPMSVRIAAYGAIFARSAGLSHEPSSRVNKLLADATELGLSSELLYLLGRAGVSIPNHDAALTISQHLSEKFDSTSKLYADLLRVEIELVGGADIVTTVSTLKNLVGTLDSWMARYLLASAFQKGGQTMDAIIEWQKCIERSGEAVAIMLDEVPSLHLYGIAERSYEKTKTGL